MLTKASKVAHRNPIRLRLSWPEVADVSQMKKLILILLLASSSAAAEIGTHLYPYDDCVSTSHRISLAPEGEELRLAKASLLPDYVAGSYKGVLDLTAGYDLHLFPDKSAMLVSWCDIGTNRLVAIGKWVILQETVRIDWKEQRFEGKEKAFFAKYHGLCERLVLYLSFDTKKTVRGVFLVSKEKDGEKIECPLWRTKEYPDWEKIKNELKKG